RRSSPRSARPSPRSPSRRCNACSSRRRINSQSRLLTHDRRDCRCRLDTLVAAIVRQWAFHDPRGEPPMRPARILLACLLAALAFPALAAPDEELLGKAKGYPIGTRINWFFDEGVRVGSFSHLDEILPHNTLRKAASPLPLRASGDAKLGYRFENNSLTLDD